MQHETMTPMAFKHTRCGGFHVGVYAILFTASHVAADGHGVFCTTQFNWWFSHDPSAAATLLTLAAPRDPALKLCTMQSNANLLYYEFQARGGLGYPNGGGFDISCTQVDASVGVPAGGCAFSYPVVANSTCRLKIFGSHVTDELQWCMSNITSSLRIGPGSDGSLNPDVHLGCGEHTIFDVHGTHYPSYQAESILFNVFANTLVAICPMSATTVNATNSTMRDGVLVGLLTAVLVITTLLLVLVLLLWLEHRGIRLNIMGLREKIPLPSPTTELTTIVNPI